MHISQSFVHAFSLQGNLLVPRRDTFGLGLAFSAAIKAGIKPRGYNNQVSTMKTGRNSYSSYNYIKMLHLQCKLRVSLPRTGIVSVQVLFCENVSLLLREINLQTFAHDN